MPCQELSPTSQSPNSAAGAAVGLADPVARCRRRRHPSQIAVVGVLDGGDEVAPGSTAPSRSGMAGDAGVGMATTGAAVPVLVRVQAVCIPTPRRCLSMSLALLPVGRNSHQRPLLDTLAANSGSCGTARRRSRSLGTTHRPRATRRGVARGAASSRGRRSPKSRVARTRGPGGATGVQPLGRAAGDRDAPGRARPRRRRRAQLTIRPLTDRAPLPGRRRRSDAERRQGDGGETSAVRCARRLTAPGARGARRPCPAGQRPSQRGQPRKPPPLPPPPLGHHRRHHCRRWPRRSARGGRIEHAGTRWWWCSCTDPLCAVPSGAWPVGVPM